MASSSVVVARRALVWPLTLVALLAIVIAALAVGRIRIAPEELFAMLSSFFGSTPAAVTAEKQLALLQIRLPRIAAALVCGAALGASGAAFQNVFRNPLVSPDILGVSTGAAAGAALAILLLPSATIALPLFALAGGLFAVLLVYAIGSRLRGHDPVLSLVLTGVIIGTLFGSLVALAKYVADPAGQLPAITFWLLGSFAAIAPADLALAVPLALVGVLPLVLLRWRINLLALPDDEARSLGIEVARLRGTVIAAATLSAAAVVCVGGVIGWVSLLVPHAARRLVGPEFTRLLPLSVALGAGFLLAIDTLCRGLSASEIPPGVLTALIGTPLFLWLFAAIRR